MGKIFDALEKSKVGNSAFIAPDNSGAARKENRPSERWSQIEKSPPAKTNEHPTDQSRDSKTKARATEDIRFRDMGAAANLDNIHEHLVMLTRPRSFEAEQFRMLRTRILFPSSGEPPRSIMVTSAVPGEGKSFVAANLAVSIAQNINHHVLLMECDIRRPSLPNYFGLGSVRGLSEYLGQGAPISSLLMKTQIEKLTIFPGGQPPQNPAELLSSNKMFQLLEEVKSRYGDRFIVIDSPPPRLTSETNAIAKEVDAIIVVVKYGSTRRAMTEDLIKNIGKKKILGIVANYFEIQQFGYDGYGRYQKYDTYYR